MLHLIKSLASIIVMGGVVFGLACMLIPPHVTRCDGIRASKRAAKRRARIAAHQIARLNRRANGETF